MKMNLLLLLVGPSSKQWKKGVIKVPSLHSCSRGNPRYLMQL